MTPLRSGVFPKQDSLQCEAPVFVCVCVWGGGGGGEESNTTGAWTLQSFVMQKERSSSMFKQRGLYYPACACAAGLSDFMGE